MAVGWFTTKYQRWNDPDRPGLVARRHPIWLNYHQQVLNDGGRFLETDLPNQNVLVRVRASVATLQAIAADPNVKRLPKDQLDDPLTTLTAAQKQALKDWITNDLGYTVAQFNNAFPGDLGNYTLRDVLKYAAQKARHPWYDQPTDTILEQDGQNSRPLGEYIPAQPDDLQAVV